MGSVFGESSLQGAERGGRMVYVATDGDRPSGPGILSIGKIGPLVAAFAIASGAAAWFAGLNPSNMVMASVPPANNALSFDERFQPIPTRSVNLSPRRLVESWSSGLELKLQQARSELALRLQSADAQTAAIEEPKASAVNNSNIPLPRSRPADIRPEAQSDPAPATPVGLPPERSMLQKLADLIPTPKFSLASLGPDTGLSHDGPDLAALGYDKTAVYDISAHAVYLPNGIRLEAHSGMGNLMDDPEHVNERMVGATPPAVYDLKPREKLFHGVAALRMIPQDASATLGRSGLLTHSFMLGPRGESNGCVSIRNYDSFLRAYRDGEFNRLVVVPRLNDAASAARLAASQPS
ncbi:MAG TPA: DUF2778 domain-containing protein [Bradyrhizobium sp.]|jgi:hypothetical protein